MAFLRRTFSICAVKGQAFSLLGRLEGLGAGAAAALGRRSFAAEQEQRWSRQRKAHALCVQQGRDLLRRGQFYMNQFRFGQSVLLHCIVYLYLLHCIVYLYLLHCIVYLYLLHCILCLFLLHCIVYLFLLHCIVNIYLYFDIMTTISQYFLSQSLSNKCFNVEKDETQLIYQIKFAREISRENFLEMNVNRGSGCRGEA